VDLARFSKLIAALYDAPLAEAGWSSVAPIMAEALVAPSCVFLMRDIGEGATPIIGRTGNWNDKAVSDYDAYYHSIDMWADGAIKVGVGKPLLSEEVISSTEYARSEIFNEYAKNLGLRCCIGITAEVDSNVLAIVGVQRSSFARPFDADDKRALALILPHFTRAMQLHRRLVALDKARQVDAAALEALSLGVMVVTASGQLVYANAVATAVLRIGEGLTTRFGQLHAQDRAKDGVLRQMINSATGTPQGVLNGGAGGVLALPRPQGQPLTLLVCPMRPGAIGLLPGQPAAMIFIGSSDSCATPRQAVLASLWGLTPAEARLAAAVLTGDRLEACSQRLGISLNTAKTQLKQVYAKSGYSGQAELLRAVLANPVLRFCID
jgi:DNA-binding CsgD family transcriptional regulator